MRYLIQFLFFNIFILSTLNISFAQSLDTLQHILMKEIVISATRTNQNILQSSHSISLIKNNFDTQVSERTTPEMLMNMAGVFVQKTNHGGGSPILRGLMGNHTLILIDGIRLNNSTFRYGPNQYFNTIDPFSIQQMEVLRGSGSVQYGSDALGGAIHVLTANPEIAQPIKLTMTGRIGSNNIEKTLNGKISYGLKKIGILGSVNFRTFGDLIGGKNTRMQSPSGYDEQSQNLKSKIMVGKGILTVSYQNLKALNVPIYHKIITENFKINKIERQQRQLTFANYKVEFNHKSIKNFELIASLHNTYENRTLQKNNKVQVTNEKDKVNTKGFTGSINTIILNKINGNSGFEIYIDKVGSKVLETTNLKEIIKRGLYPDNSKMLNYSAYTLNQYQYKKIQISTGIRLNGFKITIPTELPSTIILKPKAIVGNLSLLSLITPYSSIYSLYNTGFRAPNIDDLGTLGIVDFRYELPTFNLKPEKSASFEVGYKIRKKKLNLTTAVYYTKLTNLITRVKIPHQFIENNVVYQKQNIEKAFIQGAEINFEIFLNKNLKFYTEITHTYGQNLTKNEPLRRIPPTFGRVNLQFNNKKYFINSEFLFAAAQRRLAQGDKDDKRIGPNGTDDWRLFNLSSGYNFKKISLNFLINNITNTDYRVHGSGINGLGRVFYLTTSLSI